jgi:hypothetical protein
LLIALALAILGFLHRRRRAEPAQATSSPATEPPVPE